MVYALDSESSGEILVSSNLIVPTIIRLKVCAIVLNLFCWHKWIFALSAKLEVSLVEA